MGRVDEEPACVAQRQPAGLGGAEGACCSVLPDSAPAGAPHRDSRAGVDEGDGATDRSASRAEGGTRALRSCGCGPCTECAALRERLRAVEEERSREAADHAQERDRLTTELHKERRQRGFAAPPLPSLRSENGLPRPLPSQPLEPATGARRWGPQPQLNSPRHSAGQGQSPRCLAALRASAVRLGSALRHGAQRGAARLRRAVRPRQQSRNDSAPLVHEHPPAAGDEGRHSAYCSVSQREAQLREEHGEWDPQERCSGSASAWRKWEAAAQPPQWGGYYGSSCESCSSGGEVLPSWDPRQDKGVHWLTEGAGARGLTAATLRAVAACDCSTDSTCLERSSDPGAAPVRDRTWFRAEAWAAEVAAETCPDSLPEPVVEQRRAPDGKLYTLDEFIEFFGQAGEAEWDAAAFSPLHGSAQAQQPEIGCAPNASPRPMFTDAAADAAGALPPTVGEGCSSECSEEGLAAAAGPPEKDAPAQGESAGSESQRSGSNAGGPFALRVRLAAARARLKDEKNRAARSELLAGQLLGEREALQQRTAAAEQEATRVRERLGELESRQGRDEVAPKCGRRRCASADPGAARHCASEQGELFARQLQDSGPSVSWREVPAAHGYGATHGPHVGAEKGPVFLPNAAEGTPAHSAAPPPRCAPGGALSGLLRATR
eukprot:TRINITY_DN30656_c0_g1_i3.p1 TRINITY_DN30656_c0_g1~~TRINITY_DN30656_c0_g1_i3.p1  ORF type:complete len:686 (+),score=142.29 TRINITY_DN30656_c0_g1_i3:72-2060(+)